MNCCSMTISATGNARLRRSPAPALGSAGYFQNQDTSSTHTVGVSGDWRVNEKLKLRAEYTFSYGTVMFGEYYGVFVLATRRSRIRT